MMKASSTALVAFLFGTVLAESGGPVKLLDFTEPGAARNVWANAWGGQKKGRASYDAERKCVRVVWTNSNVTVSFRNLAALLPAASGFTGDPYGRYFLDYRVNSLEGSPKFDFHRGTEDWVVNIGMRRDGKLNRLSSAPGGWNRNGLGLDASEVEDIYILLGASGDIELYGLLAQPAAMTRIDPREYEPLDVDSFAFFPEPRILRPGKAKTPLVPSGEAAVAGEHLGYARDWFVREVRRFYGGDVPSVLFALAATPEGAAAVRRHGIADDFAKVRHDGFAVSVRNGEALVAANVPGGVMYGAHALAQAVKMASGDAGKGFVPDMQLVDWPRMAHRPLHQALRVYYHTNKYEPDFFVEMTERFQVDARFNAFMFEMNDFYDWRSVEFPKVPMMWSREDYARIVDAINANGQTVIPYVQSPGHQSDWLGVNKKLFARIREGSGGTDVLCTRNPEAWSTLTNLIEEAVEAASRNPAFAPRFFSTGADEVRWRGPHDCPLCRGTPRNCLLADHLNRVNGYVNAKGLKMMLASDMFAEAHNGLDSFKCAEVRDLLPTNVVWECWSDLDLDFIPEATAAGAECWKLLTGYHENPAWDGQVTGYGLAIYCYNWWLSVSRAGPHGNYGLLAQRLIGDYGWRTVPAKGLWKARAARWGNFLMRNWSRKPIPDGTDRFVAADISAAANGAVEGNFDFSAQELAHVPVRFAKGADGRMAGVVSGGAEARIAVGRKAASLILLQTAHLPSASRKAFFNRNRFYKDWTQGPVVAAWRVEYADGTAERIEMKYGWNIGEAECGAGKGGQFSKFIADARFAWDSADGRVAYQYEWPNPHPGKDIASITLEKAPTPVVCTLLALSLREVEER